MCFAVIVGKNASYDGSVLFGHNEQNCGPNIIHYRRIPRQTYLPGEVVELRGGGTLPQVAETWSFLWAEAPGLEFSDNCFNEWGVAVACNGCPTKEDSLEEVTARGDIQNGGLGHMLPRLVAMRAKTAREAVEMTADLINHIGYTGIGRTMTVADPNEAWVMSIARGRHYLAKRVPDDMVVVIPNMHVIGAEANLDDHQNVIASPGLVEYTIGRGWYDPACGPFSFKAAFASPQIGSMEAEYGVCSRQWQGQAVVSGERMQLPPSGPLPFSVRPTHKYTVADVACVQRGHLDDTKFDLRPQHESGSPHEIEEDIDGSYARCACNIATQESVVWQLRNWLPPEIGCVAWRATSVPCTSVYTPWYACAEGIPTAYHDDCAPEVAMMLEHHFQPNLALFQPSSNSVFWTFQQLSQLVNENHGRLAPQVTSQWLAFEQHAFDVQAAVEEVACKLLNTDAKLGRQFLSDYTVGKALQAWQQAKELLAAWQSGQ